MHEAFNEFNMKRVFCLLHYLNFSFNCLFFFFVHPFDRKPENLCYTLQSIVLPRNFPSYGIISLTNLLLFLPIVCILSIFWERKILFWLRCGLGFALNLRFWLWVGCPLWIAPRLCSWVSLLPALWLRLLFWLCISHLYLRN